MAHWSGIENGIEWWLEECGENGTPCSSDSVARPGQQSPSLAAFTCPVLNVCQTETELRRRSETTRKQLHCTEVNSNGNDRIAINYDYNWASCGWMR